MQPGIMKTVFSLKMERIRISAIILIMLLGTNGIKAQDYNHALKFQTSFGYGLSYKMIGNNDKGFEVSFIRSDKMTQASVIRIHQEPAFPRVSDKMFLLYGYGTHIAHRSSYFLWNPFTPGDGYKEISHDFFAPGFDGYVGLEYRFLKIPFNIVVDLNCNFEFFRPGYFGINFIPTAGLAYVFKDKRNH